MVGHSGYVTVQRLQALLASKDAVEVSDVDLLRRYTRQADASAFAAIVRRHGPMVFGVCQRLLHHSSDADDAFQATFAVLIRRAASLSSPQLLAGWLFQVAYRTAKRARTKRSRQHSRELPLQDIPIEMPVADVIWREVRAIFDDEVRRLPEKLRLPVVLCLMEGRTKQAAAEELGWPEGTLSSRLQQAREKLRARLARRGVAAPAGALTLALVHGVASAVVPASLATSTVESAASIAAGGAFAGPAASLTQGVIHSMFMTKLKVAAALLLAVGIFGSGMGWLLQGTPCGYAYGEHEGQGNSGRKVDQSETAPTDSTKAEIAARARLAKAIAGVASAKWELERAQGERETAKNALNQIREKTLDEPALTAAAKEKFLAKEKVATDVPWANKFFVPVDPPPVIVHDFGTVEWGSILVHRFPITNIFGTPMRIMQTPAVSCGCVRVLSFTEKLEPNAKGFVEIEMNARQFEGAKTVSVQVQFGPKYQSTAMLRVRAVAKTDVPPAPAEAELNDFMRQIGIQIEQLKLQVGEQHPEVLSLETLRMKIADYLSQSKKAQAELKLRQIEDQIDKLKIPLGEQHPEVLSLETLRMKIADYLSQTKKAQAELDLLKEARLKPDEKPKHPPEASRQKAPPKEIDAEREAMVYYEQNAKLEIREAQDTLENLKNKADGIRKKVADGLLAKDALDQIVADIKLAEAEVKQAKAALETIQATQRQMQKLVAAELRLEQLADTATKTEILQARIDVADARIVLELRKTVQLREIEFNRLRRERRQAPTEDSLKKAAAELGAAKRRLAEWK